MSWRRTAPLALTIVLTAACSAGEPDAAPEEPASVAPRPALEPTPLAGTVVVDDTSLPAERWGNNPYELAMDGDTPVVPHDTLTLTVSYSGGCACHDFTLVADSRFEESDPVGLVLFLAHDANGDTCEAYPTDSYRFDLTPVRTLYEQTYGSDEGVIRLLLRGPEPFRRVPELTYVFQASP